MSQGGHQDPRAVTQVGSRGDGSRVPLPEPQAGSRAPLLGSSCPPHQYLPGAQPSPPAPRPAPCPAPAPSRAVPASSCLLLFLLLRLVRKGGQAGLGPATAGSQEGVGANASPGLVGAHATEPRAPGAARGRVRSAGGQHTHPTRSGAQEAALSQRPSARLAGPAGRGVLPGASLGCAKRCRATLAPAHAPQQRQRRGAATSGNGHQTSPAHSCRPALRGADPAQPVWLQGAALPGRCLRSQGRAAPPSARGWRLVCPAAAAPLTPRPKPGRAGQSGAREGRGGPGARSRGPGEQRGPAGAPGRCAGAAPLLSPALPGPDTLSRTRGPSVPGCHRVTQSHTPGPLPLGGAGAAGSFPRRRAGGGRVTTCGSSSSRPRAGRGRTGSPRQVPHRCVTVAASGGLAATPGSP